MDKQKSKLSRLRLKCDNTKNNHSNQVESSQISKYFMRNRVNNEVIMIEDEQGSSVSNGTCNGKISNNRTRKKKTGVQDLEDENEFGEREPSQNFNDSALDIKFPLRNRKNVNLNPGRSDSRQTKMRERRKKITKSDRKQPTINNALKKQSSYNEKFTKIVNEQMLADDFNPEHLQMAIALSKSMMEQCEDKNNEHMPDTQERIRNIKTTLEQFGFKNSKSVSYEDNNNVLRRKLSEIRAKSILLRRKHDHMEKLIQDKVSKVLNDNENVEKNQTSMKYRILSDSLQALKPTKYIVEIDKLNDANISAYYTDLVSTEFSDIIMLLKDWGDIPGRDKSPPKYSNILSKDKSTFEINISIDNNYEKSMSDMNVLPKLVIEKADVIGKSFSNYSKIVKDKKKVILDTNISDESFEVIENQDVPTKIRATSCSEKMSKKTYQNIETSSCNSSDRAINNSEALTRSEPKIKARYQCISPDLFEEYENEIVEASHLQDHVINKSNTKIGYENLHDSKIVNDAISATELATESGGESYDSLELRANMNIDFVGPKSQMESHNTTLIRYLYDIKSTDIQIPPEDDVMDPTIANLSDFSEDSLVLCETSSKESVASRWGPRLRGKGIKKFQLDYDKFGKSTLHAKKLLKKKRKPVAEDELPIEKNVKNMESKTKSLSQMEKELLEHSSNDSCCEIINRNDFKKRTPIITINSMERSMCDEKSDRLKLKPKRTSACRNVFRKKTSDIEKHNILSNIDISNDDVNLNITEILVNNFYGKKNDEAESMRNKSIVKDKYSLSLTQKRRSDTKNKFPRTRSSLLSPDYNRSQERLVDLTQSSDESRAHRGSTEKSFTKSGTQTFSWSTDENNSDCEINNDANDCLNKLLNSTPENSPIKESTMILETENRSASFTKHNFLEEYDHIEEYDEYLKTQEKNTSPYQTKIKGRASYKKLSSSNNSPSKSTSSSPDEQKHNSSKDFQMEKTHIFPSIVCINSDDNTMSSDSEEPSMLKSFSNNIQSQSSPKITKQPAVQGEPKDNFSSLLDDDYELLQNIELTKYNSPCINSKIGDNQSLPSSKIINKSLEDIVPLSEDDDDILIKNIINSKDTEKGKVNDQNSEFLKRKENRILRIVSSSESDDEPQRLSLRSRISKLKSEKDSKSLKKYFDSDLEMHSSDEGLNTIPKTITPLKKNENNSNENRLKPYRSDFLKNLTLTLSENEDASDDELPLIKLRTRPLSQKSKSQFSPNSLNHTIDLDPETKSFEDDQYAITKPDLTTPPSKLYKQHGKENQSRSGKKESKSDETTKHPKYSLNKTPEWKENGKNTSLDKSMSDESVLVITDEELNYSVSTPYKRRRSRAVVYHDLLQHDLARLDEGSSAVSNAAAGGAPAAPEHDSCSSYDELRDYFPTNSEDFAKSPPAVDQERNATSSRSPQAEPVSSSTPVYARAKKTLNVSLVDILEFPKYRKHFPASDKPQPLRLTQLKGTPPSQSSSAFKTNVSSSANNCLNDTDFELNQLCNEVCRSYRENKASTSDDCVHSPKPSRDPYLSSPSTPTVLIVPDDCPYEVRKVNVTPKPDFERMKTPERHELLNKYGLKTKMKRRQANEMLEYIYDQTHPLGHIKVAQDTKRRKCYSTETESQPDNIDFVETNDRIIGDFGKSTSNTTPFHFTPEKENEEYYLPSRTKTKFLGCAVPLHVAFFNLVSARTDIREQILRYEPIDLEQLHTLLKEQGYRYDPKNLLSFLDKRCITFKTKNRFRKEKPLGSSQSQGRTKRSKESAAFVESSEADFILLTQPSDQVSALSQKTSSAPAKNWYHEKRFKPIEISDSE